MIWLTKKQLLFLHGQIAQATGGSDKVRDEGLMESALLSPMQTYGETELFPTIIDKAVRLACGITGNHPFIDGNKRTGAHAMFVTLRLNNIKLFYTQDELSSVFWQLAADKTGYDELREWVLKHIKNEGI